MAQQVKDSMLSLQQGGFDPWPSAVGQGSSTAAAVMCRSQLWLGFDPWSGNFHMPLVWQKKKKRHEK